ncbi:hypothetical protein GWI33_009816 [Rhynchophorus ferrugineus]|uniref:Target of rapamycin complex 2 subunit MAPKAP1 n=1 Tax=Rhynchophorus ferrugineus TaxID=354439 RepID=A0A834IVG1_RHYFE|nr:hypothetical protein GWI33_009816 [Rhynchophorus ferrugineus]
MALYDNKYWLLSHIRNSFMSTDDTGMCEVVMIGETQDVKERFFSQEAFADPDDNEDDDDDDDETGSYDLQMDADFGIRDRSMTAARLEKLENNSKKSQRVKHVKWEPRSTSMEENNDTAGDLFVRADLPSGDQKKSGLSILMEQFTHLPLNPYMEYARYDGSGQVNIPTRRYRIFLTMLPEEYRHYPLFICCIATAKIQDLIGLILLKFSTTYSDFTLKSVSNYGLYITEEDGEVDSDFPNLDPKECVAKFGFNCLGLVEHKDPTKTVSFQTTEEKVSSPDSGGGKKRTTSASKAEETKQLKEMMVMDVHNKAMEAPLYKSYRVSLVNKLRWWNMEVHLGISNDKIDVDPIVQKNSKLQLVKVTPTSHSMETIVWCQEQETRGNKMTFEIIYACIMSTKVSDRMNAYPNSAYMSSLPSSPSFKHYYFEAEKEVAEEIVNKINMILTLNSSPCRREYVAAKEKKLLLSRRGLFR